MDGDTVRKEVAALKAQLATAAQSVGSELALSDAGTAPEQAMNSQEEAMKELAVDENLSEEARASARKALEVLVSSQLLDIEQDTALKKLESEAKFASRQAQIEHTAALEAETQADVYKLEAEARAETDLTGLLGSTFAPLQEDLEELGVEAVGDLRELDAEDVKRLAAKLKKVQAKKFAKKIAALQA